MLGQVVQASQSLQASCWSIRAHSHMCARVEQSSAEAQIVSVKTEEGQAPKNSYKGVAAILQFGSQESLNRAS